jgi:adenylate kinase family enzyme
MKIAIIGNAGSGKSTLGFKLQKKLGITLYHLDQYDWKANWQHVEMKKFEKIHKDLCDRDTWIIEGQAMEQLNYRIVKADVIIFLDIAIATCLWRVIKRAIFNWGKVVPGRPKGCRERLFSFKFFEFLQRVWTFNKSSREQILLMLDGVRNKKRVYVVRTQKEIDAVIALL